jgi:hypothetical protein
MNEKPKRQVRVQIDSLVLKGFRHEDRHAIAKGLQEQLTKMLSAPGMAKRLSQTGTIPRLQVGQVNVSADAKPQQIGTATAKGIGKGLPQ